MQNSGVVAGDRMGQYKKNGELPILNSLDNLVQTHNFKYHVQAYTLLQVEFQGMETEGTKVWI